jgi:putative transposase
MSRVSKKKREALTEIIPLGSVLEDFVRENLREFVFQQGMVALQNVLEEERSQLCGAPYERGEHAARRAGSAPGELVLGGRKVTVKRPRVRNSDGEVALDSYQYFSDTDPLEERALEQMVVGVSTRKYRRSLEEVPATMGPRSTSKSAVSRRFVAATRKQLRTCLKAPLGGLGIKTVMLDGIHLAKHLVVIAVGIDVEGRKHVLGFWEGSTENTEVCVSLISDLVERGLDSQKSTLFVIDGGKALRKAISLVFGKRAIVQRCQIHKMRNVAGHLPKELQPSVRQTMREAYASKTHKTALARLKRLASSLAEEHPRAAASLKEGLEETLTIKHVGLTKLLERSLCSTNIIENLNGSVRQMTRRVKTWKTGTMALRWVATAVIDAKRKFRRLRGYKNMSRLVQYLDARDQEINRAVDEDEMAA